MAVPVTQITGNILSPSGEAPTSGRVTARLSAPGSALDGLATVRVGAEVSANLTTGGAISLALVPNDNIVPSGTYYLVTIILVLANGRRMQWAERWSVPYTPTPIDVGSVPRLSSSPTVYYTTEAAVSAGVVQQASDSAAAALASETAAGLSEAAAAASEAVAVAAEQTVAAFGSPNTVQVTATGESSTRTLAQVSADAVFGPGYSATRLPALPSTGISWNSAYRPNFNPDSYASSWGITKTIWVSRATGNDTTGTGSIRQPYKTVTKAWAIIQAGGDAAVQVIVKTGGADVLFYRDEFTPTVATLSGKRVYVTPDDASKRIYASTAQTGLSWSLTAAQNYTYEANRAAVSTVLDMSVKDAYGIPAGYTYQSSIATVEANPGSWWQSGSLVYVHTFAGTTPVEGTTLVCVNLASFAVDLGSSAEVFLRNVQVLGTGGYGAQVRNITSDYTANRFVAYGCSFSWAAQTKLATANGLTLEAVKSVLLFNCAAAYNSGDGFNFHYTRRDTGTAGSSRDYYVVAFGCVAHDNGQGNTLSLNTHNGFTCHEGAHFLGVDCRAWNCVGPLYAMVNGCNTVLVGCIGNKSANSDTGAATHTAFYFDNVSAPAGVTGAAYLEDCIGDDTIYDVSSDGSTLPITLRRFIGSKIPVATQPYVTVVG